MQINRNVYKKNCEKDLKTTNKVHPRLYKMKQKETNNALHLNNIRKKNTPPVNKAKGDRLWMCIIITAIYIIIIIRANSWFYSVST